MKFTVKRLTAEQWTKLTTSAFVSVFGKRRSPKLDRLDFTLLAVDSNEVPAAFITAIEMDAETLYWQYGGVFPNYEKSVHVWQGYKQLIGFCDRYKRITTKISNKSCGMLKMAMKAGFEITGVSYFQNETFVELTFEF